MAALALSGLAHYRATAFFLQKKAPAGTIRNIANWCDGSFETRKGFQQ
jgi:hypothetical protein